MYKIILSLLISFPLFADFVWDGQNYHNHSASQQAAALELLNEVDLFGGEAILDIGCGDGKITRELSFAFPTNLIGLFISCANCLCKKNGNGKLNFRGLRYTRIAL